MSKHIQSLVHTFQKILQKKSAEPAPQQINFDALMQTIPTPYITEEDASSALELNIEADEMRLERIRRFFDNVCSTVPQIHDVEREPFTPPLRQKSEAITLIDPDTSDGIKRVLEAFYTQEGLSDDENFKYIRKNCMPDELFQIRFTTRDNHFAILTDKNPVRESYTPFTHMVAVRQALEDNVAHEPQVA